MKTKNILLTFALVMFTSFAFSQFSSTLMSNTGTAHNFSNGTGAGAGAATPYTFANAKGTCAACHQPHNAQSVLPLWGHASTSAYTAYSSGTIQGTTDLATGNSKLCLGCHDGSANMDSFGGVAWGSGTVSMLAGDSYANFGTVLTNDHPVSISYPADGVAPAQGMKLASTLTNAKLYANRVECSSCHSMHAPTVTSKLLIVSNAGSALCLQCHAK